MYFSLAVTSIKAERPSGNVPLLMAGLPHNVSAIIAGESTSFLCALSSSSQLCGAAASISCAPAHGAAALVTHKRGGTAPALRMRPKPQSIQILAVFTALKVPDFCSFTILQTSRFLHSCR